MNVVPRKNTPVSEDSAHQAISRAYGETFGKSPETNELALLHALVWIETAQGKSVQNFNLGNITASENFPGDAWRPPWFELDENSSPRDTELHELMLKGKAPRAFRSYPSLEAGARDFVRTLRASFPEVLIAARESDSEKFRVALSQKYSKDYSDPAAGKTLETFRLALGGEPTRTPGRGGGVFLAAAVAAGLFLRSAFGKRV